MEAFRCGYCEYKCRQFSDIIHHMTHKYTQNEILIRKRKQNAYEVVRFPIIPENEMKRGNYSYQMKKDVQLQYSTLMKILSCPAQRK